MAKTTKKNANPKGLSRGRMIWRQFRKNKGAVIGMVILAIVVCVVIFAQFYYDWDEDICRVTTDVLLAPSWEHPLGTDHLGRDVLARLLYGGRWSLTLALSVVFISTALGVVYGAVATYVGGKVESVMMRVIESVMMIPGLLMVIVLVGVLGVSTVNLMIAMSIGGIPYLARLTRSAMLPIRNSDYVEAARAIGVPDWKIIFTHILPNCMSPLIVSFTMRTGSCIVSIASYSFLGLGVPKPTPEWGTMLNEARSVMGVRPELIFYPGVAIFIVVCAITLMGDGLRDALDPKLKK